MLTIENLSLEFFRYEKKYFKKESLKIISNLNLYAETGEITAIIGSSGAGKSLLAHAILGILPENSKLSGRMEFKNEPLTKKRKEKLRGREIALIPQSVNFLDPVKTAGKQVFRAAYLNTGNIKKAGKITDDAFAIYGLSDEVKNMYPFQVSGGMARRILIASATVSGADLIIADEPTTGLDADSINESLSYLRKLADQGKAIILITHDLSYALKFADKIAVFYGGTTVEIALPSDFNNIENLRHPYSKQLLMSLPQNNFSYISGFNPFGDMLAAGCVFEPRCENSSELCISEIPCKKTVNNGCVWCHNA